MFPKITELIETFISFLRINIVTDFFRDISTLSALVLKLIHSQMPK